jgi:uncharacterized membrane protein YkoI
MKKKILVGLLASGLVLTSIGLSGVNHGVFASKTSSTPAVQTVATNQENVDANVQEPSYAGSIKVSESNYTSESDESAALQSLAKITAAEAEKAALTQVPGTVVKTTLDNENGNLVYSVEIKESSGSVKDVKIDAGNGSVLIVEADNGESDSSETSSEESSQTPDTDKVQEESTTGQF